MDLDEVAHYGPPHKDLRCLQIHLFSTLVLKQLIVNTQAQHGDYSHRSTDRRRDEPTVFLWL